MTKPFAIIRKCIYLTILIVFIIVWAVLKNNPDIAEGVTRGIVRTTGQGSAFLSGLIPFLSLTEVFFLLIISLIILLVVLAIRDFLHLHPIKAVSKLLDIPLIVLLIIAHYSFACEMAYNRKEMPLPYYETEVERDDFVKIYNYFADDLNQCISEVEFETNGDLKEMKLDELTKEVKNAYAIVNDPYFNSYFGAVKPMLSSFLYREFQITGVTYSPFMEANINTLNTHVDLPLTVAHELAHTKGVMREDDANLLAFYVCVNSDNPYLRYSAYYGYFWQLSNMTSTTYLKDEQRENLHPINGQFNKTLVYAYEYWKKHDLLGDIGEFFNNLYIKSSGVEEGTASYNGGTDYEVDPLTNKLYASPYQKLFFEKYYRK